MKKIAVIGAGISGLICAYELQKAGFSVTVYEKESRVGGRMSSIRKNGFIFDIGANHLINLYTEMKKYCEELNIEWQRFPFVNYKILYKGEMREPMSILPITSKAKLLMLQFMIKSIPSYFNLSDIVYYDKTNAYAFSAEKMGKTFADYLVEGYSAGYQFHSSKEISSAALLSQMNSIRKNNPEWYLHRTKGGMIALPNALAKKLNVRLNSSIKKVTAAKKHANKKLQEKESVFVDKERYDAVVLATPATITKKILVNPSPEQKFILDKVKYSASIVIGYVMDKNTFGAVEGDTIKTPSTFWLPKIESKIIASISNEAYKGKEMIHKDKSLLLAFLHEDAARKFMRKTNKEIFDIVRKELITFLPWIKKESQLKDFELYRWNEAMPKYYHGYLPLIKNFLENGQGKNNIYLCGDYLNSLWTEGALRCGQRVAKKIIDEIN